MSLFKSNKEKDKKKVVEPTAMKDMYGTDSKVKATDVKPKADDKSKTDVKPKKSTAASQAFRILLRPLVSEKASRQQSSVNQYFFAVAIDANKIEIAKAVEAAYGVKPLKVNVIRMEGKSRRYGRQIGKRKDWKKAIVTLPVGKTITLYEGV